MFDPSAPGPALFVTNHEFLTTDGGGVQWCTREYRDTLIAAGFDLHNITFSIDRSPWARLLRRLRPRPFANRLPRRLAVAIAQAASSLGAQWCFLNNTDACSVAPALRLAAPHLRLVFLSHGVELTDIVNNLRLTPETIPFTHRQAGWLGHLLLKEIELRAVLDGVVTISEPDATMESWLGAKSILTIPRSVPRNDLHHVACLGRVGCVSTLDHGPNLHGLRLLAESLARKKGVNLRLVGGPEHIGRELAELYPTITYCGKLDDAALRAEAQTWKAFVNPIFCRARGASTKVATALGWGLPVLTTTHGARGYRWNAELLPLTETPSQLADLVSAVATAPQPNEWASAAHAIRDLAPDLTDAASLLHDQLKKIDSRPCASF
jgi:hypothetical protein